MHEQTTAAVSCRLARWRSLNLLTLSRSLFPFLHPPAIPLSSAINSDAPATPPGCSRALHSSVFAALHLQIITRGTTEQSSAPYNASFYLRFLPSFLPSFVASSMLSFLTLPSILSLCFCQSTRGTRLKGNAGNAYVVGILPTSGHRIVGKSHESVGYGKIIW